MEIDKIDLKNVKVVIFDFDNTLAIHQDRDFETHRAESEERYLEYYLKAYQNPDNFYDDVEKCTKSETLYAFIDILRRKRIKTYCLSGMRFSFHLKAKQTFVNKHYGDGIEVISTNSQPLKVDGTKIIQRANNCKLEEILFIDDNKDTVELLKRNGINALLIDEIEL